MRGTFFGLEIGKTGLTTAQFGLNMTGHNIANLDTQGYTRQRIVQTAYDPFSTIGKFAPVGQGLVGGGTRVQILDQIRSAYLDRRFRTESSQHAYWEQRTQSLTYIESFFDNVNEKTSINYSIAEFFRSMTIISQDPVSGAPRTLMQTTAMDFVQQLNMIHEGLIDFQKVENRAIQTKVGDINRMAKDLAELNVAIYTFEVTGMIANDLRDKRNLLLDELATYADIEYEEYDDPRYIDDPRAQKVSMLRVRLGGDTLVDHDWPKSDVFGLALIDNVLPGEDKVFVPYYLNRVDNNPESPTYFDPNNPDLVMLEGAKLDIRTVGGGELRSHFDMRDGFGGGIDSRDKGIPYYIDMVNNLARAMLQEINSQHIQGWSDHPDGSATNILFFDTDALIDPATGLAVSLKSYIRYYDENGGLIDLSTAFGPPLNDPAHPDFDENALRDVLIGLGMDIGSKRLEIPPEILSQVTAKNITLSKDISDSAYNIAASSVEIGRPNDVGDSGDPVELQRGNNVNMNLLYGLFRKTGITVDVDDPKNPGTTVRRDIGSFDDYGTTIRFDVGNTLHTAKQAGETSRILTLAANNQRTSVAGVSLDEEMTGLVKFNHAYNGAARVITQMDDALDRLINGTGRVGL